MVEKPIQLYTCYLYTIMYCFRICIIIVREVGLHGHGKYDVDVLNYRDKHMLKLAMAKVLNTGLI